MVVTGVDIGNLVCSIILLIITATSVICAFKTYHHQRERAKKDKASELGKYYVDNILSLGSFVNYVTNESGIIEIIKKYIPFTEINDFNQVEIKHFLPKDEYIKLVEGLSGDPVHILRYKILKESDDEKKKQMIELLASLNDSGKSNSEYNILFKQSLLSEYENAVIQLLNCLEYFSMNFKYGLADDDVVYQTTHRTFLSTVWLLYLRISLLNQNSNDCYYSNIIYLFTKWREKALSRATKTKSIFKTFDPFSGKPLN